MILLMSSAHGGLVSAEARKPRNTSDERTEGAQRESIAML